MRAAQLTAIVWLRWRLLRNQWFRGGLFNKILSVLVAIGSVLLVAGSGISGLLVGALAFNKASPPTLLAVWHGVCAVFLFAWIIALMIELQRSEDIDLTRFLHLPVSLRGIFLMNYVASHLALPVMMFVPAMVGLALGLIISQGWRLAGVLPVVLGLIFVITAWTYYLRGWLTSLMSNPRRRRMVIVGFSLSAMLLFQLPNFYFNALHKHDRASRTVRTSSRGRSLDEALAFHPYIPILWPGHTAYKAVRGQAWPALPYAAAGMLLGILGLHLAYRATLRFYRGQTKGRRVAVVRSSPTRKSAGPLLVERTLPWISPQAGAVAVTCFRSLVRAPEVRMFLGTNLIVLTVFSALLFTKLNSAPAVMRPFIASAAVGVTFFGLLQLLLNQFGFDRDGFRSLILLPVPRHQTLLGKNLAVVPFSFILTLLFSCLILALTKFSLPLLLAVFFQYLVAFFILSTAGNALSILVPYRIEPGSMRQNKVSSTTTLVGLVTHLAFPFLAGPIFLAPLFGLIAEHFGFLTADWSNLLCSVVLTLLAGGGYVLSLPMLGRLLQRREQEILLRVTREME